MGSTLPFSRDEWDKLGQDVASGGGQGTLGKSSLGLQPSRRMGGTVGAPRPLLVDVDGGPPGALGPQVELVGGPSECSPVCAAGSEGPSPWS